MSQGPLDATGEMENRMIKVASWVFQNLTIRRSLQALFMSLKISKPLLTPLSIDWLHNFTAKTFHFSSPVDT